jgi:hypothetical protein
MVAPINELVYSIGSTSGVRELNNLVLEDSSRLVAIETASMISKLSYDHDPKRSTADRSGPNPDVVASLNRSIQENAEVWEELAKY